MAISSIGVGSGLPLEQLLDDLRKGENQTLALIQSRQISVQSRLSAYGTIKNSLETLKTAADALGKAETFGALKTSVSGDGFTASASSKAIAGQYSIHVEQLASAQSLVKNVGLSSRSDAIGAGGIVTIELADGTSKVLDLSGKDTSLNGLVSAINGDPTLGVTATLINDGDPDQPHRLLLTAKNTGEQAAINKISVTGNNDLDSFIGFEKDGASPSFTEDPAKNALLTINKVAITSQTNTVENAIEGVTLTLAKASTESSPAPSALSITRDDAVTSKAVNAFVSAYNALQNQIKSLSAYDVENQRSSALTGDSLARKVQSQVRDVLNVAGASGAVRSLSQMGITTNITDGTLKVDADKLAAALKDNMVDVQNLFTGENGISKKLAGVADAFVRSDGLITSASEGITRSIDDLQKQYDAAAARIDAKMEGYRQQFTRLDSMVAQMNSVSSYLTQQLSMLGNLNDKR